MRVRGLAISAVGLMVVLGTACSSDDGDDVDAGATTEVDADADAAEHNEADVTFTTSMIPHHEQAVEMSELAPDRAQDERVLDLANRIAAAQGPEIDQMQGFLDEFGESGSMGGMDMGDDDTTSMEGMEGMEGMMSEEDMAALEGSTGAEFDAMFLAMMIEHHQGAISMAETEIADGQHSDAVALANAIKTAQEDEIAEMEALLGELG